MSRSLVVDLPKFGGVVHLPKKRDFREILESFINQHGTVERLLVNTVYNEAYCLFATADDARAVLESIQTTTCEDLQNITISFTPMTPEEEECLIRGDDVGVFIDIRREVFDKFMENAKGKVAIPMNVRSGWLPPIPGLLLITDFITEDEEAELLESLYEKPWSAQITRKVQHYGVAFDYITRSTKDEASLAKAIVEAEAATESSSSESLSLPIESGSPLYNFAKRATNFGLLGDAGNTTLNMKTYDAPVSFSEFRSDFATSSEYPETDQITINEYPPGRGIGAHVDTHSSFQDGIMSLSMSHDTVMEFQYVSDEPSDTFIDGERVEKGTSVAIVLPRRSLLLMRGEARYGWTHGITGRKTDCIDGTVVSRKTRVSATFRVSRNTPCSCRWVSTCFDQNGQSSIPSVILSNKLQQHKQILEKVKDSGTSTEPKDRRKKDPLQPHARNTAKVASVPVLVVTSTDDNEGTREIGDDTAVQPNAEESTTDEVPRDDQDDAAPQLLAEELETKHVHSLYDAIAPHFSSTRHSPWPRVEAFVRSIPPGALLVDIGCGNGKYLGVNPSLIKVGCDRSPPLVEIAMDRGYEVFVGDALTPSFRPGIADVALSIAVLHHIATVPRRIQLLEALIRSLRVGGMGMVYAWAFEQGKDSRRKFESQDVFVPWCLQRQFVTSTDEELIEQGAEIDEERNVVILQRYCHVYRDGELEELLEEATKNLGGVFNAETTTRVQAEYSENRSPGVLVRPDLSLDDLDEKTRTLCARDEITKNICSWGRSLVPATGSSSSFGVQVLESWWEKDNWCIVFRKTE